MSLKNMVLSEGSLIQKKFLENYNYGDGKISGCLALKMGAGIFQENFGVIAFLNSIMMMTVQLYELIKTCQCVHLK